MKNPSVPRVLALDLEATLISNAVSQFPHPQLFEFLERCKELFPRVVMFTTVREELFRQIARRLVEEDAAPGWLSELECIHWTGTIKDLAFIPGCVADEAILVDDLAAYVHPAQRAQWVKVDPFERLFDDSDAGLSQVLKELEARVRPDGAKGALP